MSGLQSILRWGVLTLLLTMASAAFADDAPASKAEAGSGGDAAAELARKLQDPLANIKALVTDNDILFGTGNNDISYSFQLQPVYAISFPDAGLTLIPRAIIPFQGIAPAGQRANLEDLLPTSGGYAWGMSDIATQFFVAPQTKSKWKWGLGPQLSWKTHTDADLTGAEWGAGPVAVLVGNITEDLALSFIVGHMWSYSNGFSTTTFQPMLYYNIPALPGSYIGYNAAITADWTADSSNVWTIPIGAVAGRAFDLGDGFGLDLSGGAFWNADKPDGAADWSIKFGITLVFP